MTTAKFIKHTPEGAWVDAYDSIQAKYVVGISPPHYPVPAIKLVPTFEAHKFYGVDAIVIREIRQYCDCCGDMIHTIVCLWDFDPVRSVKFFLPFGKYVNQRQIIDGVRASQELEAFSGVRQ